MSTYLSVLTNGTVISRIVLPKGVDSSLVSKLGLVKSKTGMYVNIPTMRTIMEDQGFQVVSEYPVQNDRYCTYAIDYRKG